MRVQSVDHFFTKKTDILYAITSTVTEDFITAELPRLTTPGSPAQRIASLIDRHVDDYASHARLTLATRNLTHTGRTQQPT